MADAPPPGRATVKLPGLGPVDRKWLVIAGAGGVILVGYMWLRRRANNAAAGAVDPATGSVGDTGFNNPVPGASGSDTIDNTTPGTITTNAQWVNDAATRLGDLYDAQFVIATLGKYLDGQPLTHDEANLVRSAWAVSGHPPVGDPPIILSQTTSTPGGPTPTPPPGSTTGTTTDGKVYVTVVAYKSPNPPWNSTLSGIASHEHTTVAHLLALNPSITNPSVIHVGQRIRVK